MAPTTFTKVLTIALLFGCIKALNNGLGLTPAMGWNSWNKFGCDINETVIKSNARRMLDLGLDRIGYKYLNIDDCWLSKNRDSNSHIIVDPIKFPKGMKEMGDFLHSQGLKFGLYNSAGTMTCQQLAGGLAYEQIDAADYASWGVDYFKYDNCYNLGLPGPIRYNAMRDALAKSGRPIYYSICSWGTDDVAIWGKNTGNSWRTTNDISNNWASVASNYKINDLHPESAGPGGWNDPDMLEIGNGVLTDAEERSHFALWAFAKAPLIIGADLNTIKSSSLAILKNKNLIAVNQDPAGIQASCILNCVSDIHVIGAQQNGYFAAMVINWNDDIPQALTLDFALMGAATSINQACRVRDLWTDQSLGTFVGFLNTPLIASHDNNAYKIVCDAQ